MPSLTIFAGTIRIKHAPSILISHPSLEALTAELVK